MFGQETFDFLVAGAFQPSGQFVVGQVGRQRVVAQGLGIAQVRALVALGQCTLGLVVVLTLLREVDGLRRAGGGGGKQQAGSNL
ncbi:hypothetical protein D3C81_1878610 [compost metagenome]